MILGMSTATYTLLHVLISLVGIVSGLIVMYGFLTGKRLDGLTAVFLTTTVVTSVTGFGFPFEHLLPSHKVAIISLVILAVAIPARYAFHRLSPMPVLETSRRIVPWERTCISAFVSMQWPRSLTDCRCRSCVRSA